MNTEARIQTSDGVLLVGDYVVPEKAPVRAAVLLLHMMPSDRTSWAAFTSRLAEKGYAALAIDLRGHGQSRQTADRHLLDYETFSDADHQKSIHDIEAAIAFLGEKGHHAFHLGGASIGANLALWYGAEHGAAASIFLLSPGLDYHGIKTLPLAPRLTTTALFVVASKDDVRSGGAADVMARQIYDAATVPKEIEIYKTGGHGTDIFYAHPELVDALIQWIRRADDRL